MQYRRILIFTDDPDHERNLARLLLRHRAEVASENMVYQAVTRFKNRPYDLVLLDLDMEEEGEALLDWLVEKYPRRKIIVTGRSVDEELLEHALMQKPVLGYLPKRVQPEELDALLKKSDEGLTGQVQRMHMMDLLQVLRMNQPQRLVIFSEQSTGQQGVLYIQNSEIIHAELYGSVPGRTGQLLHLSGKDAFNRIVRFRNGRFSEKTYVPPEQVTIHEPFDSLVMNASTLMDESNDTVDSASIRTILLVDTDPMHRMLVQRTLFAEGFDCRAQCQRGDVIAGRRPGGYDHYRYPEPGCDAAGVYAVAAGPPPRLPGFGVVGPGGSEF
jgi:DNA-binding NarL/FixJ family response regulator